MQSRHEDIVGPDGQDVANIDHERIFHRGHRHPDTIPINHLQSVDTTALVQDREDLMVSMCLDR